MTLTQICASIALTLNEMDTAMALQQPKHAEQCQKEMHELAWQLVNATRPKDDES